MGLELVQQQQIGLNQEALDEWIEYRREDLKKPMSQRAIDKTVKQMLAWSEFDQQRIVDKAIRDSWRGLYWCEPDKVPEENTTRGKPIEQHLTDTSWAGN